MNRRIVKHAIPEVLTGVENFVLMTALIYTFLLYQEYKYHLASLSK